MSSGFIANPNPPPPSTNVAGDGFWPEIDIAQLRNAVRVNGEVPEHRWYAIVVAAVIAVTDELAGWKREQTAAGHATLADVPDIEIAGARRLKTLYLRAVSCAALAEVSERYRSYDATNSGSQRADELTPSIDECRRDLRWAIRDFLGQPRATVELI